MAGLGRVQEGRGNHHRLSSKVTAPSSADRSRTTTLVDLEGVGACAASGESVHSGEEAELLRVLPDSNVGVGGEGELEHLGEDVREAP